MADCLEAFLEARALDRVIPVGHSMGGLIALKLARRANPRLIAQVIVASSARLAVPDQILDGLKSDFLATVDFIIRYSFDRDTAPLFPAKETQGMGGGRAARTSELRTMCAGVLCWCRLTQRCSLAFAARRAGRPGGFVG